MSGADLASQIAIQISLMNLRLSLLEPHHGTEEKTQIPPHYLPQSVPPSDDVIKEEMLALGPGAGIDFNNHPVKEEYEWILKRNPEVVLEQTFTFQIGEEKTSITPKSLFVDPSDNEHYMICDVTDSLGSRIERLQETSFLEDIYAGNLRPLEDSAALAAKLLLMDSIRKQKA
jgi:hypothetical protein